MKDQSLDITRRITRNDFIAISIGTVYLWFGLLKFFPELSPAEELAKATIQKLTFGMIQSNVTILLLALGESFIGLMLILNVYKRTIVLLALTHILFTFTPMIFFPDQVFGSSVLQPTLLGQYIGKNIIIIGALLTLYKASRAYSNRNTTGIQK